MSDLLRSAQIFEVSSKLRTASFWIAEMAAGKTPNESERETLRWVGGLLTQIDWSTEGANGASLGADLAVQATDTRPVFYTCLNHIKPKLEALNLDPKEAIPKFVSWLRDMLVQGKAIDTDLPNERYGVASGLLQLLANSLSVELGNNGLPRRPTWLSGICQ